MCSHYENRIVGYADVLGWTSACHDVTRIEDLLVVARAIAGHAKSFSKPVKKAMQTAPGLSPETIEKHSGIEFSFCSDSFAVSAPIIGAENVFKILAWTSHKLLSNGFLVRGGIAIGDLFHEQDIIFGPALIEAIGLEKKASNPRFLCSEKLIAHLSNINYKEKIVLRDGDEWIANIALGTALDGLMECLKKGEMACDEGVEKWQYLRNMLPRMYGKAQ